LYYYESIWRSWVKYCQPSLSRAYDFVEDQIAGFISKLWKEGAAASRIKATLSVLEVTKKQSYPNRPPLLDNGLIRSLIDAVVVDRPVKKKGPDGVLVPFYDVEKIFRFWASQPCNEGLRIEVLRKKAVSLLVVDLFLRGSDVFHFTVEETHFEKAHPARRPRL